MELTIRIEKLVHRGAGLGRLPDGRAVFVPYTCPGEEVRVRLVREQKSWAAGEALEILSASPARREPPCPYYGRCGGCQLMHLDYLEQREWKRRIVEELWRGEHPVAMGSRHEREFNYRHRVRLHVLEGNRDIGFMGINTNNIVEIADCLVCATPIRQAIPWIRQELLPLLSRNHVDPEEITIIVGDNPPPILRLHCRRPVDRGRRREISARAAFPVEWEGEGAEPRGTDLTIGGFAYRVNAAAFFQAHPAAADELLADPALVLPPESRLLELYCGMGLFTVMYARRVSSIVAVEGDPGCSALFDANLRPAGAENVRHVESSVEAWLATHPGGAGDFDALFLDPPRTGLGPGVRESLATEAFRHLLYLSCDIATQRRDLQAWLEGGKYAVASLVVFDFFPNTFHIECLARLHGPGAC